MSEIRLRPVHHDDVPTLAHMEVEAYGPDAWSTESWWGELAARPRRAYVVAEEYAPEQGPEPGREQGPEHGSEPGERRVRGYAGLDLGPDVADVMTITVAPDARRLGLGARLMRWLVDTATASGAAYLMLEVRSDNEAALALYRRWEFHEISRRPGYYKGADALILRRALVTAGGSAAATATDVTATGDTSMTDTTTDLRTTSSTGQETP